MTRRLLHVLTLALAVAACGDDVSTGPCGGACGGATPFCDGTRSMCVEACAPGTIGCGGTCVNTDQDPANCGRCGNPCGAGVACQNGLCGGSCAGSMCGDHCYDLDNDPQHCGDCLRSCGSGGVCLGGDCQCSDVTTDCGSYCADTTSDDDNCGGCGRHCWESEACVDSQCVCAAGFPRCDGECTDMMTDPDHCGSCERACDAGEVCQGGECICGPGLVPDGEGCVDPRSDPDACGPGLVECAEATPFCQGGVCVASCSGSEVTACGFACVDTEHDPRHCGGCSNVCGADELCADGCREFTVAAGCTTCPCDACHDGDRCCEYPGSSTLLVCLDASECPEN